MLSVANIYCVGFLASQKIVAESVSAVKITLLPEYIKWPSSQMMKIFKGF